MKRHLVILCILLGLVGTRAYAYDFAVDGIYYNIIYTTDFTCEVTSGRVGYSGDIDIPATVSYNGQTASVVGIGEAAFYGCTSLKNITIPNSVTYIGDKAFDSCSNLTSITIPNSVTSIGNYAFSGCYDLTNIIIGDSVTSIGDHAFSRCYDLTNITIGDSVTSIGDHAFAFCSNLTSITIGNSVTSIGDNAFRGCSNFTAIHITDLGAWCKIEFGNDKANPLYYAHRLYLNGKEIKDLIIPNTVTTINYNTFRNCYNFTSVTIPSSVTNIADSAFLNCTEVASITIDANNTIFDSRDNCNAIIKTNNNTLIFGCSSTNISNSVTSIGGGAFYNCSNLTGINIPNSVTSIEDDAFYGCTSLAELIIEDRTTTLNLSSIGLLDCPLQDVHIGMEDFGNIFQGNALLKKVSLGNTVTNIGTDAFAGCTGLTSITIPNSVTSIGDYAFCDCTGLTSITIPNSVTNVGNNAFLGCKSLTKLVIEDGTKDLYLFDSYLLDCPLQELYMGRSFESQLLSYGCHTSLKKVTLGNKMTFIESFAFAYCPNLTSITISNAVEKIKSSAFEDCPSLSTLIMNAETPPNLSDDAFSENQYSQIRVLVNEGSLASYQSANVWKKFWKWDSPTAINDGIYYLYNEETKQFLSRGEYWGTCACVDKYGIPFAWDKINGSLKFLDNNAYLYETDDNTFYTDAVASVGFQFIKKDNGYCLMSMKSGAYLKLAEGTHGHQTLVSTPEKNEATVWLLKTKSEHDTIITAYTTDNYNHMIAAFGLDTEIDDFVKYLSTCKATDMTSYIRTARFAGSVGGWTYNEVRAQDTQPAYGTDFCELWQATGSYTQTITGLPKGIYKVTMQGFERSGSYTQCNALGKEGFEITTTYLKANNEQVKLQSWYSEKNGTNYPNRTDEAVAAFDEGKYMNELYTYVGDDGKLTLAVNKPSHVGDNWVLFNNLTLTHYQIGTPVTSITLDKKTATLNNGETITLTATVLPEEVTEKTEVAWTSSNTNVATVNNGIVKAILAGTATITARAGGTNTDTCLITVEVTTSPVKSREYYLYDPQTKCFLTRGEYWGTCACVDKYGIPFYWNSDEGSIKFLDSNQYLYEADSTHIYTDSENSTGFQFVEKDRGYCLGSLKTATCLTLAEGSHGLKILTTTSDINAATVWQLKSKTEHDAIVAKYRTENYEHIIATAGISTTSDKFIELLSACKTTDMTFYIGTERFNGSAGYWAYNEVRAQDAQPAYGTDFCELWQATGSYTQTINGLPKGIYKVTMQGFERSGGYVQCNALGEKGYEITTATLKANGEEVNLKSWYSEKSGTNYPNRTGQAVAAFNEGKYMNELYTYVGNDGKLTLTVNKPSHVSDNWMLFNNFTLTYYEKPVEVTSVMLDRYSTELTVGETATLTAYVYPEDATDKAVIWTSANTAVATVANGVVRAVSAGTTTITAKAGEHTATCTIRVNKKVVNVTGIILDKVSAELTEGETVTLTATVSPDNATDKTVTWTSSDETVATVKDGVVTAIAAGTTTITAKAGNYIAACGVTVNAKIIHATNISLDKVSAELTEGETMTLTATVSPDNATDKTVTWTSSDETVATVKDGVVTAIAAGKATITAKAGNYIATCGVTVKAKEIAISSIVLDKNEIEVTDEDDFTLTATIYPENATNKDVVWEIADEEIVINLYQNIFIAIKEGVTTITAKAGDKTATCTVTVKKADGIENSGAEDNTWPADIYDITGRMVKKNATSTNDLEKGIYLIKGKKVIIK